MTRQQETNGLREMSEFAKQGDHCFGISIWENCPVDYFLAT